MRDDVSGRGIVGFGDTGAVTLSVEGEFRTNLPLERQSLAARLFFEQVQRVGITFVPRTPPGIHRSTALERGLTVVTRNVKDFESTGVETFDPSEGVRWVLGSSSHIGVRDMIGDGWDFGYWLLGVGVVNGGWI